MIKHIFLSIKIIKCSRDRSGRIKTYYVPLQIFFSSIFLIAFHKRSGSCNFIKKETLVQVFSCELSKISKNTFSYKAPLVAASDWEVFNFAIQTNIKGYYFKMRFSVSFKENFFWKKT